MTFDTKNCSLEKVDWPRANLRTTTHPRDDVDGGEHKENQFEIIKEKTVTWAEKIT